VDAIPLQDGDFVGLKDPAGLLLRHLAVDFATGDLRLTLDAEAATVRSGPAGRIRDHHLSLFQKLLPGPMWSWLLSWLTACCGLVAGLGFFRHR
jgi:hypothetical protein